MCFLLLSLECCPLGLWKWPTWCVPGLILLPNPCHGQRPSLDSLNHSVAGAQAWGPSMCGCQLWLLLDLDTLSPPHLAEVNVLTTSRCLSPTSQTSPQPQAAMVPKICLDFLIEFGSVVHWVSSPGLPNEAVEVTKTQSRFPEKKHLVRNRKGGMLFYISCGFFGFQ